jgi:hypothetical protein
VFEKENGYLFIGLFTDVDAAVDPVCWLIPIDLPGCDGEALTFTPIAIFNGYFTSLQNNGYPMKGVMMPGHGFTGFEMQTADKGISTSDQNFVFHIVSLFDSILDFPRMIEHMPCHASDEIARRPADAAARSSLCYLAVCRSCQTFQDRFARPLQCLTMICRVTCLSLPSQA